MLLVESENANVINAPDSLFLIKLDLGMRTARATGN
jgi:hypothetical protein